MEYDPEEYGLFFTCSHPPFFNPAPALRAAHYGFQPRPELRSKLLGSISKDGSKIMEMMMERNDEGQNKLLSIILHVVTMSEGVVRGNK